MLLLFFTACQTSSVEEVHSTKETITKTSPLTTEIQRVVMLNTSQDNFIDKSSCFAIKFPYGVTVNNIPISINSPNDYSVVQNNIDDFSNDNDIVNIHFPITILFNDYTQKRIANQTDFEFLISSCQSNSNLFGKIHCLTINYPIAINVYDSSYQIASSISINDNLAMFNFIANLINNKFIAISYPISIRNQNGQNSTITSNAQFEDVIKDAVDSCSGNTNTNLDFVKIITANSWKISYYYNNSDKTSNYNGYSFTFNTDNSLVVNKLGKSYNGNWSTFLDNGHRRFTIKINSDPLAKLDEDWKVFEFNTLQLHFKSSDNNNENEYLYFEKK
jgi:hypothetical protein